MKNTSIVKYIFLTIGLIFLAGALYFYLSKQDFLKKANIAQGTVIELVRKKTDKSTTYSPVILFTTKEGNEIKFTSSISSSPPSYNEGERVEVLYDPKNPKEASINSFASLWIGPLVLGVLGIVFFLIGFFIVWLDFSKYKKRKYLLNNGKRILTSFNQVQINYGSIVNGKSPFKIYSQWLNPQTNELYVFESDNIWFDPTDFIKNDVIKVMINPANPKEYVMDISFLPNLKN